MSEQFDTAVIGAGIAGASVAARLALAGQRVALLEMESQPGYHTTGRSAAIYSPIYGPAPIRALTRASFDFLDTPPEGFAPEPLLSSRSAVFLAREDQLDHLAALETELSEAPSVSRINGPDLQERLPLLRKNYGAAALWDVGTSEIDVAALHQGFLRQFKAAGGLLKTNAQVIQLDRNGALWTLGTKAGEISADTIVNASGAWADRIGQLAGAQEIGLIPKRRSAMIVDAPEQYETASLPLVVDVQEQFYIKPEAGKLLISPANEDPEAPCDVQPDEMDIAICVDRIERAFDISVKRIQTPWAGLRSFVADKSPVAGFSETVDGFYWLAGQGGYGIQSAPALSEFAAAEIMGNPLPPHILKEALDPSALRPNRRGLGPTANTTAQ